MRLHHSVQNPIQQSSPIANLGQKFVIRYADPQPKIVSNNKKRKKQEQIRKTQYQNMLEKKILGQSQIFTRGRKKKRDSHLNLQTQTSTSAQLRKNNIHFLKRTQSIDHIAQIQKQKDKQQEKQYSKVPIQYYDQQANGSLIDKLKGRVVYRGYAPKNTYFYLKTIKQYKFITQSTTNLRHQYQLKFNSKFQCGNLSGAVRVSSKQYWLHMRQDTNTHGLRQWYFFQVINRKPIKVKFRIYKFSKYYSLYKQGMKPFIKSSEKKFQWTQAGQNVKYQYDNEMKCHYLQFQYNFETPNSQTYFATLPPYSYTDMLEFVDAVKDMSNNINVRSLGKSLAGLDVPIIQIISKNKQKQKDKSGFLSQRQISKSFNKQAIFIMARTHPGQTVSNFALQNLVFKILQSNQLLQKYDFFIVPMVNPDGVYLGNHRTGAIGMDLNRCFHNCDPEVFPQINIIIDQVSKIKKFYKIRFLLDLHGHSAKRNIFAYGQQHQIGGERYLLSRILPKILSDTINTFKYDYSIFRVSKQKKNTARVYFSNVYNINSITFQQSYGLISDGAIGINHWRNFGTAIADSLIQFNKMYSQQNGMKRIQEYLKDQIQIEKVKFQKRIQKQKKMFQAFKMLDSQSSKTFDNPNKQKFFKKLKSNPQQQNDENKFQNNLQMINEEQANNDKSSINSQQLSSGDQELQIKQDQLQQMRKDIMRVGCLKEGIKRQLFNMADKKLQLLHYDNTSQPRLHQQKGSLAPRILKLQMKKKLVGGNNNNNFLYGPVGNNGYGYGAMISQRHALQLPSIRR